MTSKSKRSHFKLPEQVTIREGKLPEGLLRPEDRGKVIALLLPLARRELLLDRLFDGLKAEASADHPICFVDGGLHESCLPASLRDGSRPLEGVADALFFGTSEARVMVQGGEDGGWGYVPAGTPLPDPDLGWTHEAWSDLLPRLTPENGSLILLLPADFTGARVLAREADRQIALTVGSVRSGLGWFARLSMVLLLIVVLGVAWITGWLAPIGLPAPDVIPSVLDEVLQGFPRPVSRP
jgi:hypothetical protein